MQLPASPSYPNGCKIHAPFNGYRKYMRLMTKLARSLASSGAATLLVCCAAFAQAPVRPQAPVESTAPAPSYRAVTYDVRASVFPAQQMLSAQATVEFESSGPSISVESELHPNLRVTAVKDAAGRPVEFERDSNNPLVLRVTLPSALPAGQRVKLTFDYSGQLPNEQNNSPIPGTRAAWVGAQGAYLLLPGRWFPLTQFPSNRYTGTFRIDVPDTFAVAGTGVPDGSTAAPNLPVASAASAEPAPPVLVRNRNPNLPPPPEATPSAPAAPGTAQDALHLSRRPATGRGHFCRRGAPAFRGAGRGAEYLRLRSPWLRLGSGLRRRRSTHPRSLLGAIWFAAPAQSHRRADSRRHRFQLRRARPAAGQRASLGRAARYAPAGESGGLAVVGRSGHGRFPVRRLADRRSGALQRSPLRRADRQPRRHESRARGLRRRRPHVRRRRAHRRGPPPHSADLAVSLRRRQ